MTYDFTSRPAPEVARFFEEKAFKPSFHWRDVLPEEHSFAFTVAKAVKAEVLTELRDAVAKAIRTGQTLEAFKTDLKPTLKSLGWWGKQNLIDPKTGELIAAQLGSPRRLKTIYWANTRTARAAGHWERAQRTKRVLPNFIYRIGPSENHRPHHVAREGTIRPVDDPIWDDWFPPNGWGCKCWIRQISQEETDTRGGVSEPPDIPLVEVLNKRTGKTELIPLGIDPGWNTNPGKARAKNLIPHFNAKLEDAGSASPAIAKAVLQEFWQSRAPEAYARMNERVHLPVAYAPDLAKRLKAPSALVVVSNDTLAAKAAKHSGITEADFAQVEDVLSEGTAIDRREDGRGINYWLERDGRMLRLALQQSAEGFLYVSTLFVSSARRLQNHLSKYGEWEE